METQAGKQFCLYRIYSENCLLYVGATTDPLQDRLHDHFFKAPKVKAINIECVTQIEYAILASEADLIVSEAYEINRLKPALNFRGKASDCLTISLPAPAFHLYENQQIDLWRKQIQAERETDPNVCWLKSQIEKERSLKQVAIFSYPNFTLNEKEILYAAWLKNFYEPVRNGLL